METKKLLSAVLVAAAFVGAQAQDATNWHSELVAPVGTTQIYDVKANASGDVFELAIFGSKGEKPAAATFMGQEYTGDAYTGTSSSGLANFLLTKHDLRGNLLWSVYSNAGEVAISDCGFTPTTDGGVFLALKLRPNRDGGDKGVLVTLVDGVNAETTVDYVLTTTDNGWVYQPLLVKVDASGKIVKKNLLECDWSAAPAASDPMGKTTNGFYFYDAAEDGDGNLYVVGRLRRDLVIDGQTIAHHNTDAWAGDSQKPAGNAFLLKLNSDLSYNSHACTGGASTQDYFQNVRCHEGKLYLAGTLQPNADKDAVSFGGQTITPTLDGAAVISARVDAATLQADWLAQNASNSTIQVEDLTLSNDADRLFVSGSIYNKDAKDVLKVSESMELTTDANVHQGFVLELDPTTGAGTRGLIRSSSGIGKINNVIATADSVFAYGYEWGTKAIFLDSYNKNLEFGATYNLVVGGGLPIAYACAAKGDTLVTVSRANKSTAISWLGSTEMFQPSMSGNFYSVVSCFTFPGRNFTAKQDDDPTTAIETANGNEVQIYTGYNTLTIAGAEGENVRVFTALGQNIANFTAANDYETRTLPQGIYMVSVGGKMFKVVLR